MFSFFGRKPEPPKVIFLRGEARREGLDVRENPANVSELLAALAPVPFLLRLPPELPSSGISAVLEWVWSERGYRLPAVAVESHPEMVIHSFSLTVLDRVETFYTLDHDEFSPAQLIQLELSRAIVATLARFVHRDFVLAQAQAAGVEIDARLLGRLSKYLRRLLEAGWSLPAPHYWPELARSTPFDELGRGLESLRLREPHRGPRRTQLLLEALAAPSSSPETLQAIEEFWVASGQVFPEFQVEPNSLIRDFLHSPLPGFQKWSEQNADFVERIAEVEAVPAPTLPRFSRMALLAGELAPRQRQVLESYLGPLPQVLATPAQERLARQRLGP